MLVYKRVHILMVGKYNFDGIHHEHMRFLWRFVRFIEGYPERRKGISFSFASMHFGGGLCFSF